MGTSRLLGIFRSIIVLSIITLFVGCGGGGSSSSTTTAPAAPTGVTATPGNDQVTIAWTSVTGATSYNIYWSTTTGVTTANGTKIASATNPYIQTQLTNGTPYYYVVTAVNSIGESAASTQVNATPSATASAAPYINAIVRSLAQGDNNGDALQGVQVYTDSTITTPITNALVTINGTTLDYHSTSQKYKGYIVISAGSPVNLSVTIGSTTYTATGTQYTIFPNITAPTSGAFWQTANANTVTWSAGAPTTNATYYVGLIDLDGNLIYPSNDIPLIISTASTSCNIPANSVTAGSYQVMVGIITPGIGTGGIPIANTADGSGLWIGSEALVPITVQ